MKKRRKKNRNTTARRGLSVLLLLLAAASTLPAQNFVHRGFSLGADRDTLLYIIASPFDNWYLTFSGGVQTFIGNTPDPQACWNTTDYGVRAEIGKWIIPDVAVSLRLGLATVHSKSRFGGNNPWSDIKNPINYDGAEFGPYYPINANMFTAIGIVTFDWTNFLSGYEAGKHKHLHFYTPVGLGGAFLFGEIINPNFVNKVNSNPNEDDVALGETRQNLELSFTAGFMTEYFATKHIALYAAAELMLMRGSIDDYNYNLDAHYRRTDLIPSIYVGAKINLLKEVEKYSPYSKTSHKEKVNHEFLAFGTRTTVPTLTGRIENLNHQIDSIQNSADTINPADLTALQNELDSLQQKLDSIQSTPINDTPPVNVMEDLLNANEKLNLPATIVYYQLDRYEIDYNGCKRLQHFAKEINALDDTLEYYIVGAADSLTGTIRHNQWLSEKRCRAAYDMLVDHYDVDRNQFLLVPVGGIMEYDPQEYNRIALIIQRTPETEEIINRWIQHKGRSDKTIIHPR